MRALFIIACIGLLPALTADSRWYLICHEWRLVGIQSFKKEYKPAKSAVDELLAFTNDGTYEKLLYGQLKFKGAWGFTKDSSELMFNITSMNGAQMSPTPLDQFPPTDSIMRLDRDTLVIARLAYFGPKKEYGHDDWYYVKVDNTH